MANRGPSFTLVLMVALASTVIASTRAAAQPNMHPGPESRFMPLELVVFPRDPAQSKPLAQKLSSGGFLVLGRAPISGFILIAVPIAGLEEPMCEMLKMWPEVLTVERNLRGHSLGRQVASCPHNAMVPGNPCHPSGGGGVLPYPALQLTAPCPTPPAGQPNDPTWCLQWGLRNTGQIVADRTGATPLPNYNGNCWTQQGRPGIDVNLLGAWTFSTGSPLVTVAVLDSGIEKCNPDFNQGRFHPNDIALTCIGWEGYNYPCCVGDPGSGDVICNYGSARDNVGHGTLVASVIGAVVNNNLGITGMDQQCKILAGRVYGQNRTGSNNVAAVNAARFALALETIAHNPAYLSVRVINISVWIEDRPEAAFQIQAFENAVNTLTSQRRFVVTGAGNYGIDPFGNHTADTGVPANFPMAITVGAIDNRGWRVAPAFEPDPLGSNSSSVGQSLDFMAAWYG